MIFLDTNIFYNFLFKTSLTDKAKKIFLLEEDFCTSFIVLNETLYIICFKYAKDNFGVTSKTKFKKYVSEHGYNEFKDVIRFFLETLELFNVKLLEDRQNLNEMIIFMKRYSLLPNDALIASTCKYHGIKKIATFDDDFKRVDFLEIVDPSQL